MANKITSALCLSAVLAIAGTAFAQDNQYEHENRGQEQRGDEQRGDQQRGDQHRGDQHRGEEHAGPRGYERVAEPHGWNTRPQTVDRETYRHNFQAARSFHVGPYHRPQGWRVHRWAYGEILPRAYWSSQYILADYWLFALEVPPVGYEWVRVGDDALMVSVGNGEVLQVEYGVFG